MVKDVLVWLRDTAHVVRLHGPEAVSWAAAKGAWVDAVAPWHRYVVGAPKKKSQRGAHLKKGAVHYNVGNLSRGSAAGDVEADLEMTRREEHAGAADRAAEGVCAA